MPQANDNILARLAVESGSISVQDLRAARQQQQKERKEGRGSRILSAILLEHNLLDREQVRAFENLISLQSGERRRVGGYELVERMGSGSLSSVYHSVATDTGQEVALKILQPALATTARIRRFERDAHAAQRLDHPHIVRYLDIGFDKELAVHYCACELLPGADLAKVVRREKQVDQMRATRIARDVADALAHGADNGLTHGDVKPETIMVADDGSATLLHFGLAQPIAEQPIDQAPSGAVVTSAFYAPPEGARDTRSDIYSLGATLYYMVTGRRPFGDLDVHAALAAHSSEHVPWPGDLNQFLNDRLCLVIARMMARDPARRYQSARDLVADLDAVLEYGEVSVDESALGGSTVAGPGAVPLDGPASTSRRTRIARGDTRVAEAVRGAHAEPAGIVARPPSGSWSTGGTFALVVAVLVAVFTVTLVLSLVFGGS